MVIGNRCLPWRTTYKICSCLLFKHITHLDTVTSKNFTSKSHPLLLLTEQNSPWLASSTGCKIRMSCWSLRVLHGCSVVKTESLIVTENVEIIITIIHYLISSRWSTYLHVVQRGSGRYLLPTVVEKDRKKVNMNTFIKIQGEKLEIKKAAVGGTVPELTPNTHRKSHNRSQYWSQLAIAGFKQL